MLPLGLATREEHAGKAVAMFDDVIVNCNENFQAPT